MTKYYDYEAYQLACEALNDPDTPKQDLESWRHYKHYARYGFNKRIKYEVFARLESMYEEVLGDMSVSEFCKKYDSPFERSYWSEARTGALRLRKTGDEIAQTMIEYLEQEFHDSVK